MFRSKRETSHLRERVKGLTDQEVIFDKLLRMKNEEIDSLTEQLAMSKKKCASMGNIIEVRIIK